MRAITVRAGRAIYAAWGLSTLFALSLLTLVLAALVPGLGARRRACRMTARLLFVLLGTPLRVTGGEHLTNGPAVVVANHGSYLDGLILQGALPPTFAFVIKQEVRRVPLVHFVLRRIGSEFVDRHSAAGRLRDARRLVRRAARRESLAFFPEGSFGPEPGLQAFKAGAFTSAARAGLPVIPVVIHGARAMLPADRWWPAPGRIAVDILPPARPATGRPDADAVALRRLAREAIAARLAEPDLAPVQPPAPVRTSDDLPVGSR